MRAPRWLFAFLASLTLLAPTVAAAQPIAAGGPDPTIDPACGDQLPPPFRTPGNPPGGDPALQLLRTPLAPAPLWNPAGPRRVGLQAGHWLVDQVPPELGRLQGGSFGGGKAEWEANLEIAARTRTLLESVGYVVDLLPSTIPPGYRAHAFIAIHADGGASSLRGFKVARPDFSSIPDVDDQLLDDLNYEYARSTGLPRDDEHISRRMLAYYAFNSRRYCHSVAPGVPQAIVETGFLTSPLDRQLLLDRPELAAAGLANGIVAFLERRPS
jgi:N-acetylmuramoyl-L-alanine amidase